MHLPPFLYGGGRGKKCICEQLIGETDLLLWHFLFYICLWKRKCMQVIKTFLLGLVIATVLAGCEMFEYHPYDGRFDAPTDVNVTNIRRIEAACEGKDTIRFIMMGDTQGWYDETEDFVVHVNAMEHPVDFVIHGGDVADYGLTKEFQWVARCMDKMKVPYVAIIGNHDMLGTGERVFKEIFGDENFSFRAGDVKFVCLSTNALEYDYSHPVPDFSFIRQELADSLDCSKTVAVMHAPPFSDQFNNNVNTEFEYYISRFRGIQFCLHAHNHRYSASELFDDGIVYYGCDCMKNRNYLLFTITPEGYAYEMEAF